MPRAICSTAVCLVAVACLSACDLDYLHAQYGSGGAAGLGGGAFGGQGGGLGGGAAGGGGCVLQSEPTLQWARDFGDDSDQAMHAVVAVADGVLLSGSYYGQFGFGGSLLPQASPTPTGTPTGALHAKGFLAQLDRTSGAHQDQYVLDETAIVTSVVATRAADNRVLLTSHQHTSETESSRLRLSALDQPIGGSATWERLDDRVGGGPCSEGGDYGFAKVVATAAGDVVVAGSHFDCLNFDAATHDIGADAGGDIFVARFDGAASASESPLATASLSIQGGLGQSSAPADRLLDVATVGDDVIVVGKFNADTLTVHPPAGSGVPLEACNPVAGGDWTLFVARLDADLRCQWLQSFAVRTAPRNSFHWMIGRDQTTQVVADEGRVLLAVGFAGEVDFGGISLTSQGSTEPDIALVELDADGAVLRAIQLGGPAPELPHALVLAGNRLLLSGQYVDNTELGCGELQGTPLGFGYFLAALDGSSLQCTWNTAVAAEPQGAPDTGWTLLATDGCHDVYWGGSFTGRLHLGDLDARPTAADDWNLFASRFAQ